MFETLGKYVGGRVLTAILVVSSFGAGVWFWKHPEQLQTIWMTIKYVLVWLGFVLVLPWATFFVTPWVLKFDSNLAAGVMLAGYSLADVALALYLIGGPLGHDSLTWGVLLLGFLSAGVYNFMACEHQAECLESV